MFIVSVCVCVGVCVMAATLMLVLMDSLRENTAGHRVGGGVKAAVGPHVCVCVCVRVRV